jgi:hypothetical protein
MNMRIKTTAEGCHVAVSIKIENLTLLSLTDNDSGNVNLLQGITYRFEWFVFTAHDAHARIQAEVTPENEEFPLLDINKTYPAGIKDGNVFLFTLS